MAQTLLFKENSIHLQAEQVHAGLLVRAAPADGRRRQRHRGGRGRKDPGAEDHGPAAGGAPRPGGQEGRLGVEVRRGRQPSHGAEDSRHRRH